MILLTLDNNEQLLPKRLTNLVGHYAHLLNCLLELLRGHSQLLCPISEFVFFVDIDPVAVPVIAFRCVVGHGAFYSPVGRVTDLQRLTTCPVRWASIGLWRHANMPRVRLG
jgi:hypothetical protein